MGTGGSAASCVTNDVPAQLGTVNMVVLLDKSGSMGNDPKGQWSNAATRWNPVVETLDAFFNDASSSRMYASLIILPSNGVIATACSPSEYSLAGSAVVVPLTLLDANGRQAFLSRLCDASVTQNPPCIVPAGGTPTRPALQGAVSYAASEAQSNPNSKSVVVFLTDGEPGFGYLTNGGVQAMSSCDDLTNGCVTNNSVCTSPALEVGKVAAVIQSAPPNSIYVVGTGDLSSSTMDQWASASGNPAISLASLSPEQAAATLMAALKSIRTSTVSCNIEIPSPSGTASIDYTTLNLGYVDGSGHGQDLRRTSDGTAGTCSSSTLGWYYDNLTAPKTMNLCPSTCNALQQDVNGQLRIVFGCSTLLL